MGPEGSHFYLINPMIMGDPRIKLWESIANHGMDSLKVDHTVRKPVLKDHTLQYP